MTTEAIKNCTKYQEKKHWHQSKITLFTTCQVTKILKWLKSHQNMCCWQLWLIFKVSRLNSVLILFVSIQKIVNNKNVLCDAKQNWKQDKPLWRCDDNECVPEWGQTAVAIHVQLLWIIILQQQHYLSSISSEISKAFSIISNDFQNCTDTWLSFLRKIMVDAIDGI